LSSHDVGLLNLLDGLHFISWLEVLSASDTVGIPLVEEVNPGSLASLARIVNTSLSSPSFLPHLGA